MKKLLFTLCLATIAINNIFAGSQEDLILNYHAFILDTKAVEEDIAKGANVNAISEGGTTPLVSVVSSLRPPHNFHPDYAEAEKNAIAIIKLLISKGADVNMKTDEGTVLSFATQPYLEIPAAVIQALKDAGAR